MWKFEQVMGICVMGGCAILIYALTKSFWATVIGAPLITMFISTMTQAICMSEPRRKKQ